MIMMTYGERITKDYDDLPIDIYKDITNVLLSYLYWRITLIYMTTRHVTKNKIETYPLIIRITTQCSDNIYNTRTSQINVSCVK